VDTSRPDGLRTAGRGRQPLDDCLPRQVTRSAFKRLVRLEHTRLAPASHETTFEIAAHPFLTTLDNPDGFGYFDRASLLSLIVRQCDVIGSSWLYPVGPRNAPPIVMWPLYAQYVIPVRRVSSPLIDYFMYFADHIDFDNMLWFTLNRSLRDPYGTGYSPTYATAMYSDLEDKFVAIQDQLLGMGPRPNVVMSPKDPTFPPGEAERVRYQQDMNRQLAAAGAGGLLVTNGSWDFTPISYSPADLAAMQISEYDMERICNAFGVPPAMMTTETNLANIEAAKAKHAEDAIEPRCHMIATTLTRIARRWDPRLFFAFDSAVAEDEERTARIFDMKLKNGTVTINQANAETEFPPVPWGDEPWMSSSVLQPSMIQANHQMSLTQQATAVEGQQVANEQALGGGEEGGDEEFAMDDGEDQDFGDQEGGGEPAASQEEEPAGGEPPGEEPASEYDESLMDDDRFVKGRSMVDLAIDRALSQLEADIASGNGHDDGWLDLLRFNKGEGNPYHDKEGHFTSQGKVGHAAPKPPSMSDLRGRHRDERHATGKRQREEKESLHQKHAKDREQVEKRLNSMQEDWDSLIQKGFMTREQAEDYKAGTRKGMASAHDDEHEELDKKHAKEREEIIDRHRKERQKHRGISGDDARHEKTGETSAEDDSGDSHEEAASDSGRQDQIPNNLADLRSEHKKSRIKMRKRHQEEVARIDKQYQIYRERDQKNLEEAKTDADRKKMADWIAGSKQREENAKAELKTKHDFERGMLLERQREDQKLLDLKATKLDTEHDVFEWGEKHYGYAWQEQGMEQGLFTKEEMKGMAGYVTESTFPNNYLRKPSKKITPEKLEGIQRCIKGMDSLMDKTPVPEDVVGVRYASFKDMKIDPEKIKPGATFEDKAYTSVSLRQDWSWARGGDRIEVHIPKGHKAFFVGGPQSEMVLPRGTSFRVRGFKDATKYRPRTMIVEPVQ
jgi:hypothetical protein